MNKGFIALTSILVISVVALSIAVSVAILGVGEAKNSLDYKKGIEALRIAEACAEEGLLRSRNDLSFTSGGLSFQNGTCNIQVTDTGSGSQVDVEGIVTGPPNYHKNIRILSEQDGNGVTIVTWQETN